MRRSALIVDDSRVAALGLKRLLEPHAVSVDTVESGEEALEYLRSNVPPSVVFLDHMMPGMDGFEVLGLIKRDPRLAAIPVVMYTSKEGEAYMGQALARGAYDVLAKPPSPVVLLRLLERMAVLDEPIPELKRVNEPAPTAMPMPTPVRAAVTPRSVPPPPLPPIAPTPKVAAAPAADAATAPPPAPAAATSEPAGSIWDSLWFVLYTLLLAAPAFWYFYQYREAEQGRLVLAAEHRTLQQQLALVADPVPIAAVTPPAAPTAGWIDALAWAVNLHNQYGYNQLPLDEERLSLVRGLIARLNKVGFQGVLRLETHVGEFCLARDGHGGFVLPEAHAPIADCEIIAYKADEAATLGRRQSPAFSRYLVTRASLASPIEIEVISYGNERPLSRYPNVATLRTAGEWNAIAARNNRVQFVLVPDSP